MACSCGLPFGSICLQVRGDLFHESLNIMLKDLKILEKVGFKYNLGTDEWPDIVTVYPFPLRYTVDHPEAMTLLGLAMSSGNYPHPNYLVPVWKEKNGVRRGMGMDCPDIPRHYAHRTEADQLSSLPLNSPAAKARSITYAATPAVFGWFYRDAFLWVKTVDRLHNCWNGICTYIILAIKLTWTDQYKSTIYSGLSGVADVSTVAIEALATKGTLTGRNKSQVVWMLPYIAEGVGFFREGSDTYNIHTTRVQVPYQA